MCVIAFAWQVHPRWRLLLAGNRDEFHPRPSAALTRWEDAPIIAGRDLQAGGSWLGVSDAGCCAVVTNVRDPRDPRNGASRGLLVSDYLVGAEDARAHADRLLQVAADYRPFNLLTFDAQAAFYLGNRPEPQAQAVTPGVHGLSNADFNTPWPKTRALQAAVSGWAADRDGEIEALFAALRDERRFGDGEGIEPVGSPVFIRHPVYGTRCSTVVTVDRDGRGMIAERRFAPDGAVAGETRLAFAWPD